MKRHYFLVLLFLILLLFSFFRFYLLDKRVIFDWDQERDAFIIKQILVEKKLTLIGPRVLGPEGFFLGPYFTYLLTPFYFVTSLHPQAIILFIVIYSLGFFGLTFWVLQKLFNHLVALIFLLIWALHPSLIGIDKIAWNPILVPLIIIFSWLLVFKLFKKPSFFLLLAIGLIAGLGINFHFQLIYLVPFILVFLFSQKKRQFKKAIVFFSGFILPFLPLFLFDLRHSFLNLRLLIDFLFKKSGEANWLAWLPVWKNVSVGFVGFDFPFLPLLFYLLPLGIIIFLWRKETDNFMKRFYLASMVSWLIFPFGFALFGQRPSEYYFNFLYPFLVVLLVLFLLKTVKKWQLIFLLALLFLLLRGNQLETELQPNPLGLSYKEKVVQRIGEIGRGKKFNVSFSVPLGMDTGYRYLLDFYQIKQSQDPNDALLRIVVPPEKEPVDEVFGGIGLFIPENFEK